MEKQVGGIGLRQKEIIVGMDVGTSHIRVIVGEHRSDGTINIIGVGLKPLPGRE